MSIRLAWILFAAGCWSCEPSFATPLDCPKPPAQTARNVSVETRATLAALGKLGAGELQNKVQVTVQPLLDKVPNVDKVLLAQMLTSVFCQLLSDDKIDSREKLERFQTFSRSVMDMASSTPPVRSTSTTTQPAKVGTAPRQSLPITKAATANPQPKTIGLGATVKEVGEYLAGRPTEWTREKPVAVAFSRNLDGLT